MNPTIRTPETSLAFKHFGNEDDPCSSAPQFLFPYLERGQHLLDYGCGTGIATLELADILFPGQVTGMDINSTKHAEQLSFGRELINASFHTGNAYQLPFQDETFDIIYAHDLLEILKRPITALIELCRVLRSGGILAVSYTQRSNGSSSTSQKNITGKRIASPSTILNVWITAVDLKILESESFSVTTRDNSPVQSSVPLSHYASTNHPDPFRSYTVSCKF